VALGAVGCNLVLGITELSSSGLGGSGGTPSSSTSSSSTSSSSASSASASTSSSSGGCGDTTSSAANCGACGHSCNGGQCFMSHCLPVNLTTGVPGAIAVDDTSVYWTHQPLPASASIMKSPKTGGNGISLADAVMPQAIALDTSTVYWADYDGSNGSVWTVPKTVASPKQLDTGSPGRPAGIAVSATDVYWTFPTMGHVLMIANHAFGTAGIKFVPGFQPTGIAVDDKNVYWSDWGLGGGGVEQTPFSGSPTPVLANGQGKVASVVAVSGVVYWVAQTGYLSSAPASNPTMMATVVAMGPQATHPQYIAANGSDIYWNVDTGIMKFTVGVSTTAVQIVTGQVTTINGVAADETGAYWTASDGFVRYVAK
jgi:hypothetical protein